MHKNLIHFESLDWESPKEGIQEKVYFEGNRKLRLLRFYDNFIEEDWCLKGHVGFVLEGEMKVDFKGRIETYKKGDGLWINEGDVSKHKVIIEKGKYIELILFEIVK